MRATQTGTAPDGSRRIATRLLRKQGPSPAAGEGVWAEVDLASAVDSDPVAVGVEHAAWAALEQLDLPALLRQLRFNRRPLCGALGCGASINLRIGDKQGENPGERRMLPHSPRGEGQKNSARRPV